MTDDTGATPDPKDTAGEKPADTATPPEQGDGSTDSPDGLQLALKAERAARKAGEKRTRELETRLREFEDRDKTESEKLTQRAAESERRAVEAEAKLLRVQVAAERGFKASAIPLLNGTTLEEIQASADALAAYATDNQTPVPGFDGGARTTPAETQSPEQAHNEWLMKAIGRQP